MSKYYVGYLNIKRKYTCKTGKLTEKNWKNQISVEKREKINTEKCHR